MENAPVLWALFLPWILLGILQPHQKHGKESRPLSFAVSEPWGLNGELRVFGGVSDTKNWQNGFKDFMRDTRMINEDTIEAYIRYIGIVANRLGRRVEELASTGEQFNETIRMIEDVADWKLKTKSNYRTAINRLNAYFRGNGTAEEKGSCGDISSSQKTSGTSSTPDPEGSNKSQKERLSKNVLDKTVLLGQINEIERMARENEDKTWNSVFKCVSAYALGMPSVVIVLGINLFGCLLALTSAFFAFGGVAALIPVLRRSSRQLKEIQEYGERLHFEGKQFGCIRPADWTVNEKLSVVLSAASLLVSVLFLGLAKVVGS